MCGICGFISKDEITIDTLKEMNDTMKHRGPDDSGEKIIKEERYNIGFAQRRLSILDLSSAGHQPMFSDDKEVIIVFNGEIYNFLEIKEELKDYQFKSECDTEVILAAYLKWGIKCIEKFNGMFSIAIYDRLKKVLYLVRDRIGKKPLYYWYKDNNIVFASELKPIMKYPSFEKNINKKIIKKYLFHGYIGGKDTIFENVYKVKAGTYIEFKDNKITENVYWDLIKEYKKQTVLKEKKYEEYKKELKDLIINSVKLRMISDVPLGTFLSGGYDSSLVTAVAQSLSSIPLKTFSIGFYDEKYNEAKDAKRIAEYLKTNHTEYYISEKDILPLVEEIVKFFDEPFSDSSQLATMLVSKIAKTEITTVLSGDGGDELFCGYEFYDKVKIAQLTDKIGKLIYYVINFSFFKKYNLLSMLPLRVRAVIKNQNSKTKLQFNGEYNRSLCSKLVKEDKEDEKFSEEKVKFVKNWQIARMLLDMKNYLVDDILCKVDRSTMKYSLEARCPLLDKNIIEYSFKIPHKYKYHFFNKKYILKEITYDYIPKKLLDRPKKGFAVPLKGWLKGPLKNKLLKYNKEFLEKQDIFNVNEINKIIEEFLTQDKNEDINTTNILWHYLVFQMWYEEYI